MTTALCWYILYILQYVPSRFDAAADLSLEDSMAFGCDIVAGESKTVDPAPARLPDDFTVDKAPWKSSKGIQRFFHGELCLHGKSQI